MHTELDDLPSDVQTPILAVGWLVWGGTAVLALWSTLIAFGGGSLPLVDVAMDGGLVSGLLWFLFVAPTLMVIGHCISVALIGLLAVTVGTVLPRRAHRH